MTVFRFVISKELPADPSESSVMCIEADVHAPTREAAWKLLAPYLNNKLVAKQFGHQGQYDRVVLFFTEKDLATRG